jgi:5-methyltetrahydropteroyltriglutamate--homocysteine methyltransferase
MAPSPPSPTFQAYQHGIYPRSEAVVGATRDLERGRTTPEAVEAAFEADRQTFLTLQREAGLDYLSDGFLRWQDLFRPLVDATEGLDARVLVRWFDNNSFYRAPEPLGSPRFRELPSWVLSDGIPEPRVATLPSPFLFSRAARWDGDRDDLMLMLTREIMVSAVADLAAAGYGLIHLEEPWLTYFGIEQDSWKPLEQSMALIRDAAGDATLVLHTYYGDAAPHADRLRRLPVDAVGIDFDETEADDLPAPWETGLLAGVLDGRRSLTEAAGDVSDFVAQLVERLEPTTLFVSSGSDLELSGPEVAPSKVRALGRAAAMLRETL